MIPFQLHRRIPLIRRPFLQRDLARQEAQELRDRAAEHEALIARLKTQIAELKDKIEVPSAKIEVPSAKIFCIGLGKTGTTTLEAFFRTLGFKLGDQAKGEMLIRDWAVRNFERIIALVRTAQVFQDVPFSLPFTFVILDWAFPGSKFILSVRDDAEQWYRSMTRFHTQIIGKNRIPTADDLKEFPYRYKGWLFEARKLIYGISEEDPYDKTRVLKLYESHNHAVTEYFRHRSESLLTVNVSDADAAKKIMAFLELPYTGQKMPHLNRSAEEVEPIYAKGKPIAGIFQPECTKHNDATIDVREGNGPWRLTAPGPRWSYAASWAVSTEKELESPFLIEIELRVGGGTIGIGCVTRDCSKFKGKEVFVEPAQTIQTATVVVDDVSYLGHLIIRNADIAGSAAEIEVVAINTFIAKPVD
jgi:hypothetical protein